MSSENGSPPEQYVDETIKRKLLQSPAFLSLSAEQLVKEQLLLRKWRALHSTYYRDLETRKLREVDVIGRQTWEHCEDDIKIALELIIEVKSAREFHLLFSPYDQPWEMSKLEVPVSPGQLMRDWVGVSRKPRLFERIFRRSTLSDSEVALVREQANALAYPDGYAVIAPLMIDPPPVKWNSSGFRELSLGKEKDLENSVLWRAGQSLMSTIRALKVARRRSRLNEARIFVEMEKNETEPSLVHEVLDSLDQAFRAFDQFHPIVVIDSQLWYLSGTDLQPIPWCRLILANSRGFPHFWFDVVNTGTFADYADQLTTAYTERLTESGAELVNDEYLL